MIVAWLHAVTSEGCGFTVQIDAPDSCKKMNLQRRSDLFDRLAFHAITLVKLRGAWEKCVLYTDGRDLPADCYAKPEAL